MIMTKSDHEQSLVTTVATNLRPQLQGLERQVTKWIPPKNYNTPVVNPRIILEIQTLRKKMEEYSSQLE